MTYLAALRNGAVRAVKRFSFDVHDGFGKAAASAAGEVVQCYSDMLIFAVRHCRAIRHHNC